MFDLAEASKQILDHIRSSEARLWSFLIEPFIILKLKNPPMHGFFVVRKVDQGILMSKKLVGL